MCELKQEICGNLVLSAPFCSFPKIALKYQKVFWILFYFVFNLNLKVDFICLVLSVASSTQIFCGSED
jgi:hypothetical protein